MKYCSVYKQFKASTSKQKQATRSIKSVPNYTRSHSFGTIAEGSESNIVRIFEQDSSSTTLGGVNAENGDCNLS